MDGKQTYLSMDDLKNGFVYIFSARNGFIGVWNSEVKGFVFIREKFGRKYLFTEYHWDTGPPFGTVHPYFEFEKCPIEDIRECWRSEDKENVLIENRPLYEYLSSIEEKGWKLYSEWKVEQNRLYEEEQNQKAKDLGMTLDEYKELYSTATRYFLTKLRWLPSAKEYVEAGSFVDIKTKNIKRYEEDLILDENRLKELEAIVPEDKRLKFKAVVDQIEQYQRSML